MKESLCLEIRYIEDIHTAFQLCPQPKQNWSSCLLYLQQCIHTILNPFNSLYAQIHKWEILRNLK